jgi:peptidoglycan/xylan/chitin deacetylase (PgdA/CDA1 family)
MADRTLRSAVKRLAQEQRDQTVSMIEHMAGCALGDGVGDTALYDPLRWGEVDTMVQSGLIEIGSHTHTHVILARCQPDRVTRELQHSKDIIEHRLLRPCTAFCYPNGRTGDFNAETRSLVRAHGYTSALTTVYGRNSRDADVFALKRYNFGKPMVWGESEVRIAGTMG